MHVVWMVLLDGRSIVAGCAAETREGLKRALADPDGLLALTSDDRVDVVPTSAVRDFVFCDVRSGIPAAATIYRSFTVEH
jgi:hypothetical protein